MSKSRPVRSVRPANRPSRRHDILEAATTLLAVQPPDQIAVSDIASHCGMTPAAFYYHFASKDEILDEIVTGFASEWSDAVLAALSEVTDKEHLPAIIDTMLDWVDEHKEAARIYFVTSVGATSSCEAIRRKTRNDLARRAARTFRSVAPNQDRIKVAIGGLGLVTLLEIVARSQLELDSSYRTLGVVRFRATAGHLAASLLR
jgi:AcrR family transcriptional regulator